MKMKEMTPGQRLIWAAMFAQVFYDLQVRPRDDRPPCSEYECNCVSCNSFSAAEKAIDIASSVIFVLEDVLAHEKGEFDGPDDPCLVRLKEMMNRTE